MNGTPNIKKQSCVCSGSSRSCSSSCCQGTRDEPWVTGVVEAPIGDVPVISTKPTWQDMVGAWKVRWGIGRMKYTIEPGLYAVSEPDATAPVLVSANYKLTFDTLRVELAGLNCWLLILDTKGVNVWCAAGKGTFGTDELVRQVEQSEIGALVNKREFDGKEVYGNVPQSAKM